MTISRTLTHVDGKELKAIVVPAMYGVTPFVKVWKVLELIFEDLGVRIESNPFKNDPELARLVILNATADSMCARYFTDESGVRSPYPVHMLNYADLMPDITVVAFMDVMWAKFGLTYSVDMVHGTARLEFIRDILRKQPLRDWTQAKSNWPEVRHEAPGYLVLASGTSFEKAAPERESFREYLGDYYLPDVITHVGLADPSAPFAREITYMQLTGEWVRYDTRARREISRSSSFFKWQPVSPADAEAVEITSGDECVPIRAVSLSGEQTLTAMPIFPIGPHHRHTFIANTNEQAGDVPVSFLFAMPDRAGGTIGRNCATNESLWEADNEHRLTLYHDFKNGLFATFWREYDEILRHCALSAEVNIRMSYSEASTTDMLCPVMMDGQRCLVDSMSYTITGDKRIDVTATLKVIDPRGKYEIDREQGVADMNL